jgi:phosphopantetheinyl transferase
MWTITLTGPAGGPARIPICLVTPGELSPARALRRLSPRERALMRRRGAPAARADFIAGRLAARALMGPGFEVLSGRRGEPVAAVGGGRRAEGLALSVSHSRGFGMAGLIVGGGWRLGVDVESRKELSGRLRGRVLTERERRRVARSGSARSGLAALEHWVLKEAALKAIGGRVTVATLISSPGAVEVVGLRRRGWGRVRLPDGRQARGCLLSKAGVTMAVVLAPR